MKKVKSILLLVLIAGTLISYISVWISPETLKLSAGISILIPAFLILNLLVLIFFLLKGTKRVVIPLVLLILGYPFIKISYGFGASGQAEGGFSLISYNVKWFVEGKADPDYDILDYIHELDGDIVCMQEFHDTRKNIQKINRNGRYEVVIDRQSNNLAIFSSFKVLASGVLFEGKRFNNIQFADLLIDSGDTLRVYNLHLQSMGIDTGNLNDAESIRDEYEEVKTKFLGGAAIRAGQIEVLMDHMDMCTHPMLVAGDFNDVPYSYNYFRFRRRLNNAFEQVGSGMGVTYNGRLPFLRIDHQFYSEGLRVHAFDTFDDAAYSDHFPVLGIYSISD